jgi:hypothetical protein
MGRPSPRMPTQPPPGADTVRLALRGSSFVIASDPGHRLELPYAELADLERACSQVRHHLRRLGDPLAPPADPAAPPPIGAERGRLDDLDQLIRLLNLLDVRRGLTMARQLGQVGGHPDQWKALGAILDRLGVHA